MGESFVLLILIKLLINVISKLIIYLKWNTL